MFRILAFALALLAGTSAWAQSYDPRLAYALASGKSYYVYVANRDGTHAVRLYADDANISGVDFAPGGGRIVVGDRAGVKVLAYTASSSGVHLDSVTSLDGGAAAGPPDFSDDGARILYFRSSQLSDPSKVPGFWVVAATGGTPKLVYPGSALDAVRWLRSADLGSAFAYLKTVPHGPNVPVDYEIWTVLLDAQDNVSSAGPTLSTADHAFKYIEDFDIAHTRNSLLVTVSDAVGRSLIDFDVPTRAITVRSHALIFRCHYSDDDSWFGAKEEVKGGFFIDAVDSATGAQTRVIAKANYGAFDVRP